MSNIRSEAAILRVIARYPYVRIIMVADEPVLIFKDENGPVAELDLREFVAKRKSLKGVSKRISKALRTPRKKK